MDRILCVTGPRGEYSVVAAIDASSVYLVERDGSVIMALTNQQIAIRMAEQLASFQEYDVDTQDGHA
jgi:hypothetical protein